MNGRWSSLVQVDVVSQLYFLEDPSMQAYHRLVSVLQRIRQDVATLLEKEAINAACRPRFCQVSVTTALAVLPTNRLRAGSKATDHFKRGREDLMLALSTCRLGRRRSGCVAAMFHQCPQRAFWPPRRAPRARESSCGCGKVTSGSRHQRDISGAKRSVVPSIGDGGGQQLSCRCWRCDTAHWTQPRRKTDKVAS